MMANDLELNPDINGEQDDPYLVNALVRGLELLRCFTAEHPTLTLSEIATCLGWSRAAPFRIVYTLQKMGYLQQEPNSKRYRLTSKVLELGFDYLHSLQLPEIARPYLEQLRDETGASAHLGILDGNEVVYIGRVQSRMSVSSNVGIGSRLPLHATSMGKILLAFQNQATQRIPTLTAYTPATITEQSRLNEELACIRREGIAFSNQEYEAGIRSLAAPVRDLHGKVVAAINISAPVTVLDSPEKITRATEALRRASREISNWLGFRPGQN